MTDSQVLAIMVAIVCALWWLAIVLRATYNRKTDKQWQEYWQRSGW